MTAKSRYDALIVGGGLAGSSLAISLAAAGRAVLLVEKSVAAHPKVCGEFLSYEALHYLAAAGIDPVALGAVPIDSVRLATDQVLASICLPFRALSLSRERLDEALLKRAADGGVSVLRGQRVQSLEKNHSGWQAQVAGGETLGAGDAFLATGKHDLFGWSRPAGKQNDLLAFKMCWRLGMAQAAELRRHVDLILFPGGYAGLQPVEDGGANLCLLVRKELFREVGGSWTALVAHMERHSAHLSARLAGATQLWDRPLSLSSIPYGYVRKRAGQGLWRLGDQAAVIPSFAGDGMSIALHSARLAAMVYLAGEAAETYQRRLAHDVGRQVGLATLISRGLVSTRASPVLGGVVRMWPRLLAFAAGSTRLQARRLLL